MEKSYKLVEQSCELLSNQSYEDMLDIVETAGRICYKSEKKGDPEAFVRGIIRRGHESVIEHASLTFKIVTNRAISHEIVRHRIASYSQESTRYCNYKNNPVEFIRSDYEIDEEFLEHVVRTYNNMLENGHRPEEARDCLPNCLKTELVMTMNMRSIRHFLKLRLHKNAHPQIRELSQMIYEIVKEKYPIFVFDIK